MIYKRHPLSAEFGDMPSHEFNQLVQDIKRNGLNHPVLVWQNQVLDGWHRYTACLKADVPPVIEEFDGDEFDAVVRVTSDNMLRRHLNEAQRVSLVKKLSGWHAQRAESGSNQHTQKQGVTTVTPSNSSVAKAAGVSKLTVQRHTIVEDKAPALLPSVESGALGLATAHKIAQEIEPEVIAKSSVDALKRMVAERPDVRLAKAMAKARDLVAEVEGLVGMGVDITDLWLLLGEAKSLIRPVVVSKVRKNA